MKTIKAKKTFSPAVLTGNALTLKGLTYTVSCSKFSHEAEDLKVVDLTKNELTTYSVTEDHNTLTGEKVVACTCLGFLNHKKCKHLIVLDMVK